MIFKKNAAILVTAVIAGLSLVLLAISPGDKTNFLAGILVLTLASLVTQIRKKLES